MDGQINGPAAPRPKAIPSHLVNGHSPLHPAYASNRERDDRDSTFNSIKTSMGPHKEPIDIEQLHLDDDEQSRRNHTYPTKSSKSIRPGSMKK